MKDTEGLANVMMKFAAIAGLFLLGCFVEYLEKIM